MNFLNDNILINQIDNVAISGLTTQLISFCVNDIYKRNNKNILIVTNSLYEANIYYSSISKLKPFALNGKMKEIIINTVITILPTFPCEPFGRSKENITENISVIHTV